MRPNRLLSLLLCTAFVLIGLVLPPRAHGQTSVAPASTVDPPEAAASERPASVLRDAPDAQMHHIVNGSATLYRHADASLPLGTLSMRTPVQRLGCTSDGWCRIRTDGGRVGYVPQASVSNVWIRISKRDRRLYLYRGARLVDVMNADFGYNPFGDKQQRGSQQERDHWRTPNGAFFVVRKNPSSTFHKALVLNYPTADDARRGLQQGLISAAEHDAIVQAESDGTMPPMNTELGGWIEIHGDGTGAATTWTQGCVAIHNRDIDRLWWWVPVGTPVVIE